MHRQRASYLCVKTMAMCVLPGRLEEEKGLLMRAQLVWTMQSSKLAGGGR